MTDPLAALRDLLPPGEIEELEAIATDLDEATSSPQALRHWERKAARERAQEQAPLIAYRRMRGRT